MLFPDLTSLLHPACPDWFRAPIAAYVSLLPLRPQGVKHTINFIASSISQVPFGSDASLPDRKSQSSALSLSLEVIMRASKVLSAVPSSLSADTYFTSLAPQLLQLLDGQNDDDRRAAAYVIGNGILGRRKNGSPGTIGWRLFARPILEAINPTLTKERSDSMGETNPSANLSPTVVSESSLQLALDRLASLTILHPNPGLTKRLIDPCVLALWELLCYSREFKRVFWAEKIQRLLGIYFKTSVSVNKLLFLGENLLHDEALPWMYGAGTAGGIEIRRKTMSLSTQPDIYAVIKQIDLRIGEFMSLLKAGVASDDDIAALFAHICKNWFLGATGEGEEGVLQKGHTQMNGLYSLVHAKLSQEILKEYKDKIAASPRRIIEFSNQLLVAYVKKPENGKVLRKTSPRTSLAALETIAAVETLQKTQSNDDESSKKDSTEMISMVFSLLAAILSSPEFSSDSQTLQILNDLQSNIDSFTSNGLVPAHLIIAITNVSALLNLRISLHPSRTKKKPIRPDPYASDRKEHDLALSYLTDALPPIRAQGLSQLTSLIKKPSPVIDVQSTTILLQSLLQDEDEFIYLSAIKALGSLAARHSKTVLRMLVDGYIDVEEKSSVDVRIRIGEALLKTIETLGDALVGETAKLIGESMITVAGRRAQKPKSASARDEKLKREESTRREAEEAWGGEVPSPEMGTEVDTEQESLKRILNDWQGRPGADDLRVRASALSILGTCIEKSIASLGSSITSSAVDMGLSILSLETGPEAAILRRAAVLLILSLARALDAVAEVGRDLGPGFGFERRTVHDVIEYLRQVGAADADEIVSGHSEVAVEALETWMEKMVMRGVRDSGQGLGAWGRDLSSGLRGLSVGVSQKRDHVHEDRPRIEELD